MTKQDFILIAKKMIKNMQNTPRPKLYVYKGMRLGYYKALEEIIQKVKDFKKN